MTCTLLLIRHGETDWNRCWRYQGHADPPLNRVGRTQAARLARSLNHLRLDALYSSDLRRATATAAALAAGRGLAVLTDPRLRELDFGDWDGETAAAVQAAAGAAWQSWQADPVRQAPPSGETAARLWQRFTCALADCRRHPSGTVAVVTHGGPLRLLLAHLATAQVHPSLAHSIPPGGWMLVSGGCWQ